MFSLHHWADAACTDVYNYACEDEGYKDPCLGCESQFSLLQRVLIAMVLVVSQNYSVSTDTVNWIKAIKVALYFEYFKLQKSWSAARVECKKLGGDLVMMESPAENVCVRHIIRAAGIKLFC